MSRPSKLGTVLLKAESSWAEDNASMAGAIAIPTLGPVDLSGIRAPKQASGRTVQGLQEGTMPHRMPWEIEFTVEFFLPGHGSAATGAVTATDVMTLLGWVLGNLNLLASGTTVNTAGATVTNLPVAAANGIPPGAIVFVGTKGDGGGDGQPVPVNSHAANAIALGLALPAAPANGAVVYGSEIVYPFESAANANVQSLRALLKTANLQQLVHGVFPKSITLTFPTGERPRGSVTFGGSWAEYVAEAFPDTTAKNEFVPAPVAAGTFVLAPRGSTTRDATTVKTLTSFSMTFDLGITPRTGYGGVNPYQNIIGATRAWREQACSFELMVDSEAATTTPTEEGQSDSNTQFYQAMVNFNGAAPGQRLAMHFPNCCYAERPVQSEADERNQKTIRMTAYKGTDDTSDLTASCFRLAAS